MATVPGGRDPVPRVRAFYEVHTGVVVVAQVLGLLAAGALVPFVLGLGGAVRSRGPVVVAGLAVVAAAVLTAVPVLLLVVLAGGAGVRVVHDLAVASDGVDVLLFAVIAAFAAVIAAATTAPLLRGLAAAVAVLAAVRAVLLLSGSGLLEMLAPVAF